MTPFRKLLGEYLNYRSGLGFQLRKHHLTLPLFVDFLEQQRAKRITTSLVVQWSRLPTGCHLNWWADRFTMARRFALYCQARYPRTEVPPVGMIATIPHRPTPHIYSDDEIGRILAAARRLFGGRCIRSDTYATLFGLLAATGLRAREALRLDQADVNLSTGLLIIRNTKFRQNRWVPLAPDCVQALRRYSVRRDQRIPTGNPSPFFRHPNGVRVTYAACYATFHNLLHRVGLRQPRQRRGPRLHDLRHTFAVQTLVRWYREGQDIQQLLPVLSTYLGHRSVLGTYWYLSASPELLRHAGERLETVWGN